MNWSPLEVVPLSFPLFVPAPSHWTHFVHIAGMSLAYVVKTTVFGLTAWLITVTSSYYLADLSVSISIDGLVVLLLLRIDTVFVS